LPPPGAQARSSITPATEKALAAKPGQPYELATEGVSADIDLDPVHSFLTTPANSE
jgi:hypothetical protein